MNRRVVVWGPSLAYAALIFAASQIPPALERLAGDHYFEGLDKFPHAAEFGLLFVLLHRSFSLEGHRTPGRWAALGAALYAVSDELHQSFVPLRSCQLGDVLADWVGVAAAWYVVRLAGRRLPWAVLAGGGE